MSRTVKNPIGSPVEPNKFLKHLSLVDVYLLLKLLFIYMTVFPVLGNLVEKRKKMEIFIWKYIEDSRRHPQKIQQKQLELLSPCYTLGRAW